MGLLVDSCGGGGGVWCVVLFLVSFECVVGGVRGLVVGGAGV